MGGAGVWQAEGEGGYAQKSPEPWGVSAMPGCPPSKKVAPNKVKEAQETLFKTM